MKSKVGIFFVGMAALGLLLVGSFAQASPVGAEPPPLSAPPEVVVWHDGGPYPWLRESIILAAAHTIGISVEEVKHGLRAGHSLKEIAARHGVRPPELMRGILEFERHFLARKVAAGELTRPEAARILDFLTEHIERIINYHPSP